MAETIKPEIQFLIDLLDRAYNRKSWHGTNLRGSLRGLSVDELIWRPDRNRHNIWEITIHCAYWKYVVLRRIKKLEKGGFPRSPSDWPVIPPITNLKNWRLDVAILNKYHNELKETVTQLSPGYLQNNPPKGEFTFTQLVQGVASHDLYHAGQIQLIKKLQIG